MRNWRFVKVRCSFSLKKTPHSSLLTNISPLRLASVMISSSVISSGKYRRAERFSLRYFFLRQLRHTLS